MNHTIIAQQFMAQFSKETGLQPEKKALSSRYLWTDAFAVCNYLALARQSGREEFLNLAVRLVDQVHEILGHHRDDDPRSGSISGLKEQENRFHPTAGGLRIGKKLPERRPGEQFDERLEWERDGQYYHYLTKWMHALCCLSAVTKNPTYTLWAAELAKRSHSAFCYAAADGSKRMYWKMSIDLSRPQIDSMGHHDPLDGLITAIEIRELRARYTAQGWPILDDVIKDLSDMCRGVNWATADPLGLGTLLADAWRLAQLHSLSAQIFLPGLLSEMLNAAIIGLSIYGKDETMQLPAIYRLAFRELGLAIGLQAIPRIESLANREPDLFRSESSLVPMLNDLKHYLQLQEQIERFWLKTENREVAIWTEHGDINTVMLATCLVPGGYLDLW